MMPGVEGNRWRPNRRELLALLGNGATHAALIASGCGAGTGWADEAQARALRVLFFNTHLLPAIAQLAVGHRGQDEYRTAAIAQRVSSFDLVGLCEVFEPDRREQIVRHVGEAMPGPWHVVASPRARPPHVVGGGLLLLSRYPIDGTTHVLTYREASRVAKHGLAADGLAAKGVVHARLRCSEQPRVLVDCFLTHLESISVEARRAQIDELADFIAAHRSPDRPALLLGDLNVTADFPVGAARPGSEYRYLTTRLAAAGCDLIDVWPVFENGRGGTSDALAQPECRRIDYVWVSRPEADRGAQLQTTAVRVEPMRDAQIKQGSLSDHAAVACDVTLHATTQ